MKKVLWTAVIVMVVLFGVKTGAFAWEITGDLGMNLYTSDDVDSVAPSFKMQVVAPLEWQWMNRYGAFAPYGWGSIAGAELSEYGSDMTLFGVGVGARWEPTTLPGFSFFVEAGYYMPDLDKTNYSVDKTVTIPNPQRVRLEQFGFTVPQGWFPDTTQMVTHTYKYDVDNGFGAGLGMSYHYMLAYNWLLSASAGYYWLNLDATQSDADLSHARMSAALTYRW